MENLNEIRNLVRKILIKESLPPPKQLTMTDIDLYFLLDRAFKCQTKEDVARIYKEIVFGDPDYQHPPSNCPPGAMM